MAGPNPKFSAEASQGGRIVEAEGGELHGWAAEAHTAADPPEHPGKLAAIHRQANSAHRHLQLIGGLLQVHVESQPPLVLLGDGKVDGHDPWPAMS